MENLFQKHPSKPHNPSIAYVFYLAGFIETWGRGIEKICEACSRDGVLIPEYKILPSDIMVKFTASEDRIIRGLHQNLHQNLHQKIPQKTVDRSDDILRLIRQNASVSTTTIAKELAVSLRTIKTDMTNLVNSGIIERVGSARGGYWKIKTNKTRQ